MKDRATKLILLFLLGALPVFQSSAASIQGKVKDANNEVIVGANITLEGVSNYAVTGLDGSYSLNKLQPGKYLLYVSYVGYKRFEKQLVISDEKEIIELTIELEFLLLELREVVVTGAVEKGSETEARNIEKNSVSTVNIISAKAISLSPDLSAANVIQRVSGLSAERNSNGDPQYAIVRGMDKRYSYTLVNGIKIPSPDSKNRYVPLDIFPASLLERLEVYKSLTAEQEADAIGGGINLVMKSAPEHRELKGDFQLGYNTINITNGFDRYTISSVDKLSPRQLYGNSYQAQPADFSKRNLEIKNTNPIPDMIASLSYGNRFIHNKLGVMIGTSFQNTYRGTKSIWFDYDTDRFGSNLPSLRSFQNRHYATQQIRTATHMRVDFVLNSLHRFSFYSGYYKLNSFEARQIRETFLDGRNYDPNTGNAILSYSSRTKNTYQGIFTNTLQGFHKLASYLSVDWSGVISKAINDQPDNARFIRNGELKNFEEQPQNIERRNSRQWSNNQDRDMTVYLNVMLQPKSWNRSFVKLGGLYRNKNRDSYFNRYLFDPSPSLQLQYKDWVSFSDVKWSIVNPAGSATDEMNYQAHENIYATYVLGKVDLPKWELVAGLREEHTDQGYRLKFPVADQKPDSSQQYVNVLPSVVFKYKISPDVSLRASYFKGISRPSYFEIVPYQLEDDGYKDIGNPSLKQVKSDNIDLRFERFTGPSDQVLFGIFYKHIVDPIEYAVTRAGVNNEPVMQPNNFGTAQNAGIEADVIHYFNKFGIRANYTYTRSTITTSKALRTRTDPSDPASDLTVVSVDQTRSLQGQAKHIGNVSFLYKDLKKGWEGQLAIVYTGERLEAISPFLDNDMYAKPIVLVDFSIEKRLSQTLDLFIKASNLLNSSYQVFIKKPLYQEEGKTVLYPHQTESGKTLVRQDQYYQSFRVGLRVQLNKN